MNRDTINEKIKDKEKTIAELRLKIQYLKVEKINLENNLNNTVKENQTLKLQIEKNFNEMSIKESQETISIKNSIMTHDISFGQKFIKPDIIKAEQDIINNLKERLNNTISLHTFSKHENESLKSQNLRLETVIKDMTKQKDEK